MSTYGQRNAKVFPWKLWWHWNREYLTQQIFPCLWYKMGLSWWKSLLARSTVTIYYIINSHVEKFIYTLPSVIKAVGIGLVNPVTAGPVWKLISHVNAVWLLGYCYWPDTHALLKSKLHRLYVASNYNIISYLLYPSEC